MDSLRLVPVTAHHSPVLENLWQFYLYDFSEFYCDEDDGHVDERGLFDPELDTGLFTRPHQPGAPRRWAYLAQVGGRWAGFALISDHLYRKMGPHTPTVADGRSVDEFFIMRCFRRQGLGRSMAFQLFDGFRGYWQISQIDANLPAQAFWRRVISAYTAGRYKDFTAEEGGQMIAWQTFDSSTWQR
jgi:predicted acetyltransferase